MQRSPMIVVARGRFGTAASRILEQARGCGPITRDALAARTGLSAATVARTAGALVGGGLLRERPDLAVVGATGRPGVPVEVDPDRYVALGVHVGARLLTVALGDPVGRVLATRTTSRRPGAVPDLAWIGDQFVGLLREHPGRVPLTAGLVAPWRDVGLDEQGCGRELHDVLGLDVTTSDHIAAVAAAEFIHRRHGTGGVTAYFYARNTIGFAVAVDKGGQTEVSRAASLTHFPTTAEARCGCGRTGCLAAAATDHAVATAAAEVGLVDRPDIEAVHRAAAAGVRPARELLAQRARRLGEAAAMVRDMVTPDRMVLVGQGFTDYPGVLDEAVQAFTAASALGPVELSFTRFGAEVQALAACTVALGPVYDDPLAALPAGVRRLPAPASA